MPVLIRWLVRWIAGAGAAAGVLIGLWLVVQHAEQRGRRAQREADRQVTELELSRARAADLAHALAVERRRATITENRNDALSADLADARARAAAHLRRVRDESAPTERGGADMPRASRAAAIAGGSDTDAVVSRADLDICVENSVRLVNARHWYREQEEVKR